MKAICCPQCGGLIRNILPRRPIAECDYCGAKVITDWQSSAFEPFDEEAAKFRALAALPATPRPPVQSIFMAIAFVGVFFLVIFIISFLPVKSSSVAPAAPEPYKPIVFPVSSPDLQKPFKK